MNNNEHPFLISKPDDEVNAILAKQSVYLAKRLCGDTALHYLYCVKQCNPISNEGTLAFLQKQFKSKLVSVEITISSADCDKLILSQLKIPASTQVVLIKRKFFLKEGIIAFERIYLAPTKTEYIL